MIDKFINIIWQKNEIIAKILDTILVDNNTKYLVELFDKDKDQFITITIFPDSILNIHELGVNEYWKEFNEDDLKNRNNLFPAQLGLTKIICKY